MAKVIPGRYTAQIEEPFVVFMIEMRINKFVAFHKMQFLTSRIEKQQNN